MSLSCVEVQSNDAKNNARIKVVPDNTKAIYCDLCRNLFKILR